MVNLVDEIQTALLNDSVKPLAKLYVVSIAKQMLTADANYTYLMLFQTMTLPWMQGIVGFERNLPIA